MDAETREALEGSIRKWKAIVDGSGVDHGTRNCPLCHLFLDRDDFCAGCPVLEYTGMPFCEETPYQEKWNKLHDNYSVKDEKSRKAAQAELDFLVSLRPAKEGAS